MACQAARWVARRAVRVGMGVGPAGRRVRQSRGSGGHVVGMKPGNIELGRRIRCAHATMPVGMVGRAA